MWVITNAAYKHYYHRDAGAQLVGSTNTDMKFNTPSGLHAALANVDILIEETYIAGAYTFSRALGKSQEQAPKGRGRGGSGYAMHVALHSARTSRGG